MSYLTASSEPYSELYQEEIDRLQDKVREIRRTSDGLKMEVDKLRSDVS